MHNQQSSSRLPRMLLQLAGSHIADLSAYDPAACDAMIEFFVRHGYLKHDPLMPHRSLVMRNQPIARYQRTTKGDWLLHQLLDGIDRRRSAA